MGGQEFLINHTMKHIVRIDNDGHYNISRELQNALERYSWSLNDDIELVLYEYCDIGEIEHLIQECSYRIDGVDLEWFVR